MEVKEPTILVIGDIMLDKYIIGNVERISPEAPVPVVKVTKEYSTLGGCGNVVRNLRKLGAKTIVLSCVGTDLNGDEIQTQLTSISAFSFLLRDSRPTTVKQRIVATERQTQMLRVDYEETKKFPFSSLVWFLEKKIKEYNIDVVIISDYAKGMISFELMEYLKENFGKIIVDPKPENGAMYNGVFMITPNEKEWNQMILSSSYQLNKVQYALITKGSKGMELCQLTRSKVIEIPAHPVEVYNPSGAGDTVVAVMSYCIALDFDLVRSAKIANKCAGYVVTKPGTTAVSREVFDEACKEFE
jgi:rfaE bifunctional protein kinase chain/domain